MLMAAGIATTGRFWSYAEDAGFLISLAGLLVALLAWIIVLAQLAWPKHRSRSRLLAVALASFGLPLLPIPLVRLAVNAIWGDERLAEMAHQLSNASAPQTVETPYLDATEAILFVNGAYLPLSLEASERVSQSAVLSVRSLAATGEHVLHIFLLRSGEIAARDSAELERTCVVNGAALALAGSVIQLENWTSLEPEFCSLGLSVEP